MNRRDMIKKTTLALPAIVTMKIGRDAMGNQGSGMPPPKEGTTCKPDSKHGHVPWWRYLFGWVR